MNKKNKVVIGIVLLVVIILLGAILPVLFVKEKISVTDFESCVAAGNGVMESFPEQCMHKGITYTKVYPDQVDLSDVQSCQIDQDCIPLPSECHPTSCINKDFEDNFEKPEMCTMIFMYEAAYSPEDCVCQQNVCVNKNLGRSAE